MKEVKLILTRSIKKKDTGKYIPYCAHPRTEIDEMERTVECLDCGKKLDAFQYILDWANQERRYEMEVIHKKRELAKLHAEFEELKKTVGYLKRKSSIKSHN